METKKIKHEKKQNPEFLENVKKYKRGDNIPLKPIETKQVKTFLKKSEKKSHQNAVKAAESELLLVEDGGYLEAEGMEKTFKFTQKQIQEEVDLQTKSKMFELQLNEFGGYTVDYTRNGKYMLIGGQKGHLATFDWKSGKLGCEFHVQETIRDVKWLHNETLFAVAQKKYTYIYDNTGMEIHCLRKHVEVNQLEFLPYHFLLASVGNPGYLRYQDTSTGQLVAEHKTKLGPCNVMRQNPYNAIIHLGHSNGTVTLWSPSMTTPIVKMLCHKGPVKALSIDRSGKYMASSGLDGQLKIWDLRNYKEVHAYYTPTPANTLDISHTGVLSVGWGPHVTLWKDALRVKQTSPYMNHLLPSQTVLSTKFAPFEDILGVGHTGGVSSLVVPGSGEANYDALELNPYETKKMRQEREVHALLEKLQPETITLNPQFVGTVDKVSDEVKKAERKVQWEANHPGEEYEPKNKSRGRNRSMRRYLNKQKNVIDPKREALRARLEAQEKERKRQREQKSQEEAGKPYDALDRFSKKRK